MSGGLDSTYAAMKLIEEGHSVEGAVILMHEHTEIDAAKETADDLGIPIHVIDARQKFEERVVKNFISEYLCARTPNPCTVCNSEVKFRELFDYAMANSFDAIATGHYAKIVKRDTPCGVKYAVANAKDLKKDQTYMLWRLPQDILSRLVFPLSECEKSTIKKIAKEKNISAVNRDESQEICFIPSGDYASFIEERTYPSPHGDFIDEEGRVLGEHRGIIRYTVGQRKGLGIAMGERVFVTKIDPISNTVTISPNDSFASEVSISNMVFSGICEPRVGEELSFSVKLRYLAPKIPVRLSYLGGGKARLFLATPIRALTPGQSAVLYDGDVLVAGGFID